MNEDIQQITEEYQNLIEKFESNKALSAETLEKDAEDQGFDGRDF